MYIVIFQILINVLIFKLVSSDKFVNIYKNLAYVLFPVTFAIAYTTKFIYEIAMLSGAPDAIAFATNNEFIFGVLLTVILIILIQLIFNKILIKYIRINKQ